MTNRVVAVAVLCLALLSFFRFPGHTWLQQDSQIYAPILEHLHDPAVLSKDILVERPHVSFTIYDELARVLRAVTTLDFHYVLVILQILTRALAIWGFYLMATAAGLDLAPALLVAAILSLGAFIAGPEVMILEYEPVPRGFAVPLLILGIGLAAHRRLMAASIAGAVAFLIHPPTAYPFWLAFAILARRNLRALIPMLAAAVALFVAAKFQSGQGEAQAFFTTVTPQMEKLQRMRAFYPWISMWWQSLLPQYLLLCAVVVAGYVRLNRQMTAELRFFQIALPLIGTLSMPLSALLLERMKWALMPQFQPMRALLFVTLFTIFTAAAAGCVAASKRHWPESIAWFAIAYLLPVQPRLIAPLAPKTIAAVVVLAAFAAIAVFTRRLVPIAALAAFLLFGPGPANPLDTPALRQLSGWARQNTPQDAVFLFPDSGKQHTPGIFRTEALRAVYVDWKGGGQVNYLQHLGEQWWQRWQSAMTHPLTPAEYHAKGIDYLVLKPAHYLPGLSPVFTNEEFTVYRLE